MFNCLLHPNDTKNYFLHQKYSNYGMKTKHKPNTHYDQCNYTCSFKMCYLTHFISFNSWSVF